MRSIFCVLAFFLGCPAVFENSPALLERQQRHPEHGSGHPSEPRANQGRIPPAPQRHNPTVSSQQYSREEERRPDGKVDRSPHVSNDHWYGHDDPGDRRYHLDRPYEHGHFTHFGPSYHYGVVRIDRDALRFWFSGGYYFQIAPWDWTLASDWCWDYGDNFVVYEDPDHPGWYLVYNSETGAYVHAEYMGG